MKVIMMGLMLMLNVFAAQKPQAEEVKSMDLSSTMNYRMKALEVRADRESDEIEIFINAAVIVYGEQNLKFGEELFVQKRTDGLHLKLKREDCKAASSEIKNAQLLFCSVKKTDNSEILISRVLEATHHSIPYEIQKEKIKIESFTLSVVENITRGISGGQSLLTVQVKINVEKENGESNFLRFKKDSLLPTLSWNQ